MSMTAVEVAERQGRFRAYGFLSLASLVCIVMVLVRSGFQSDFMQGLWFGLLVGCAVNLLPIKRWLMPRSEVVRLLEDEGARENRRISCTVGFWAANAVAIVLGMASHSDLAVTAEELGQFVATAGVASAMVAFAILELRAAR
jgi:hypothetical protein